MEVFSLWISNLQIGSMNLLQFFRFCEWYMLLSHWNWNLQSFFVMLPGLHHCWKNNPQYHSPHSIGLKRCFFPNLKRDTPTKIFSMVYKRDLSSLNNTSSLLVTLPFYIMWYPTIFQQNMYWSQETHILAYFVLCMISLKMFIRIAIYTKKLCKDLAYEACDCMCTPSYVPKTSKTYYTTYVSH